jgi:hypothetical protein
MGGTGLGWAGLGWAGLDLISIKIQKFQKMSYIMEFLLENSV